MDHGIRILGLLKDQRLSVTEMLRQCAVLPHVAEVPSLGRER